MSGLPDSPESEVGSLVCPRCGTSYAGNLCPNCGWPASESPLAQTQTLRTILGVLWLLAMILFVVYLGVMLISLVIVSPGIVEGIVLGACSTCTAFLLWINPLSPNLFQFVEFGGAALLVWFSIVLAVIVGLYLYLLLRHARGTYRDMRLPPERVAEKLSSRSPIVTVGQIFMAILFFNTIYIALILPAVGVEAELRPISPPWYFLFIVVTATVWEEASFRVLLIGVPLVLASLVTRLPLVLSGQPARGEGRGRYLVGSFKYLFGGQAHEGSSRTAVWVGAGLVLVSAIIFGYVHVPGAGEWRFVNTFMSGLAMGYLFLRHGILASILFHLSVNSLGIIGELAVPNLASTALYGLLLWAFVAFGAGFLAYYAKRLGGFLLRPLIGTRRRPVSAPQPNLRPSDPAGETLLFPVTCPQCGGHEAQYQDGALLCSRCGTRFATPGPDRGRGQLLD